MKKLLVLLSILALAGCQPPGGSPAHRAPVSVNIGGAHGLFLQGQGVSKSARVVSSSSALLMRLNADATSAPAQYTDAQGQPVTVTVNRTLQLDAAYLLIDYTADGTAGIAVVTIADGTMRELPTLPDNWDRVRVKAGTAYWVTSGALIKTDLGTMASVDISQGDLISSGSLLFLDGAGNVHTFYLINGLMDVRNQIRIYFADGSPVDTLGWGSPDAYQLYERTLFPNLGNAAFEDSATGRVYYLASGVGGLKTQEVTFDATGVYTSAPQYFDSAFIDGGTYAMPAAGKAYLSNTAIMGEQTVASVTLDGSGAITGANVRSLWVYSQPTVYRSGKVYTADASGVNVIELSTGIGSQIVNAAGITAVEVVADAVYFSTPSGVYQRDGAGTVTLYSAVPVDVVPVTEP